MNKKMFWLVCFSLFVSPVAVFAQAQLVKSGAKAVTSAEYLKITTEKILAEQAARNAAIAQIPLPSMQQLFFPTVEIQLLHTSTMQAITAKNLKNLELKIKEQAQLPKPPTRAERYARLQAKYPVSPVQFRVMGETGFVYAVEKTSTQAAETLPQSVLKKSFQSLAAFLKPSPKQERVPTTEGMEVIPSPIADKVPAELERITRFSTYPHVADLLKNKKGISYQESRNILHTARYGVQKFLQLVEDSAAQGIAVNMTAKEFAQLMADASFIGVFGSELDILPLVGLLRAMPQELAPYADTIVGRSLVSLKGYAGLNEIASLRGAEGLLTGSFWHDLRLYNESYLLGISLPKPSQEMDINWTKYDVYLEEYSSLNTFGSYIHLPAWMSMVKRKIMK